MPRFVYSALDARGEEQSGELDAGSADAATRALKERGLFPTAIVSAPGSASVTAAADGRKSKRATLATSDGGTASDRPKWTAAAPFARGTGRRVLARKIRLPFVPPVSAKELAVFTRQLATLLKAGMPLLRGIEVLARQQMSRELSRVAAALGSDVRSGGRLSDAMARHPRVFDRLFVNMVKAGEAGGVLEVVLERLARFQEKSLQLRGKVQAALVYPAIVMSVAVLILVGLLVFVVPKFQQIFADLLKGAPLPPLTQAVVSVSNLVREHFGMVAAVGIASWFGFLAFRRTASGARVIGGAVIHAPIFGPLILKSLVARFARTFGTLLASGVPILQALTITRETTGNARLAAALAYVHDRVKEGDPVAAPLEATAVFPGMVTSLIEVGEQTGQLAEMLNKIADIYDDEVDTAVAALSSLLEPVLIVLLAAVVGTIVIALFLPIVRIVQLLT